LAFPDYDGVGLLNFARLLKRSIAPVEFWLMPEWVASLRKYGSNPLWQKTESDFTAALARLDALGMPQEKKSPCEARS
jgi:hypothetical protein